MPTPPAPTKWRRRRLRNLTARPRASKISSARSFAASGLARRAGLLAHEDQLLAVLQLLGDGAGEVLRREVPLFHDGRRARLVERPGVVDLVAEAAPMKGTRIDGRPAAASSETVSAPARQTTRSAHAMSSGASAERARASSSPADARTAAGGDEILLARLVDDLEPRLLEKDRRARHGPVHDPRSLAAAEDQEPARRRGGVERRNREELGTDRRSGDDAGLAEVGVRRGDPDGGPGREAVEEAVGDARDGVGLVDQRRDAERARGRQHGHRHVTAHADDRPRPCFFRSAPRLEETRRGAPRARRSGGRASSRRSPRRPTSSSGKPAAGTSLVSSPCGVPTKRTGVPCCGRGSPGRARCPGKMCPPVPPAAMT